MAMAMSAVKVGPSVAVGRRVAGVRGRSSAAVARRVAPKANAAAAVAAPVTAAVTEAVTDAAVSAVPAAATNAALGTVANQAVPDLSMAIAADAAWILTCSALVLFMTLPGLSAFYGGLVRRKNQLSVFMQCLVCACVTSVMWFGFGYSLCFGDAPNAVVGGLDKAFMSGITLDSMVETLPEALWALYQMTFAVITPALMIGAFVERMKFNASIIYMALWSLFVYYPACHLIWGGGALGNAGVIDFAGGIVVHVTAGVGALVAAIVVGPRKKNQMVAGNILLTLLGTGMLWVGWFGFNGGSAAAAGAQAAFANLVTHLSASMAGLTWMAADIRETGKTSVIGVCTGCVAGLAAITPAAGSVGPKGAIVIGLLSAIICRFFSTTVKEKLGYDDSLDVFGVHGVGGFVGTILLAILGTPAWGGFNETAVLPQLVIQLSAAVGVGLYTAVASYACLKITSTMTDGLRVSDDTEVGAGLDTVCHGETCYSIEEKEELRTIVA